VPLAFIEPKIGCKLGASFIPRKTYRADFFTALFPSFVKPMPTRLSNRLCLAARPSSVPLRRQRTRHALRHHVARPRGAAPALKHATPVQGFRAFLSARARAVLHSLCFAALRRRTLRGGLARPAAGQQAAGLPASPLRQPKSRVRATGWFVNFVGH
jgi:hypothetical protein